MYKDYTEKNVGPEVLYEFYCKRIKEMNISFTKLGLEQCKFCNCYKNHHDPSISEANFQKHRKMYLEVRVQYQNYGTLSTSSEESETVYVSVDLQKVILLPHLPHYKSAIFTSRLIVFNETFVPLGE